MKNSLTKIAVTVVLAVALTISCSDDSGDGKNGDVTYGGKTYKTVVIGNQIWMAENLNYNANGSKCYEDDPNCSKYGKLYSWAAAMALSSDCNSKSCASQISEKHRGICPSGWHIPSSREWAVLIDYIETQECGCETQPCTGCAITYLKATDGWNSLVSGEEKDTRADWWTTYENDADYAYGWNIKWRLGEGWGFFGTLYDKDSLLSVRCLKDNSKDDMSSSLSDLPVTFNAIPFDMDIWFTGNPTNGACSACSPLPNNGGFPNINQIWDPEIGRMVPVPSTNTTVHGFGQKGTPIPPQRAGELILTAFPSTTNATAYEAWSKDPQMQKLFGLPPEVSDYGPYGIADPKKETPYGGYVFVKNGFPNENSVGTNGQLAPTRCTTRFDENGEPRFNCPNFRLVAIQPFQISVTLYDQRGNFVTEYRETVTEKEFRSVVQGPNYTDSEKSSVSKDGKIGKNASKNCQVPTSNNFGQPNVLTTNGLVKANVNIYPFSAKGEPLNGIYTVKIDRVNLPYDGCVNANGIPVYVSGDYRHYHADQKFEWISR